MVESWFGTMVVKGRNGRSVEVVLSGARLRDRSGSRGTKIFNIYLDASEAYCLPFGCAFALLRSFLASVNIDLSHTLRGGAQSPHLHKDLVSSTVPQLRTSGPNLQPRALAIPPPCPPPSKHANARTFGPTSALAPELAIALPRSQPGPPSIRTRRQTGTRTTIPEARRAGRPTAAHTCRCRRAREVDI